MKHVPEFASTILLYWNYYLGEKGSASLGCLNTNVKCSWDHKTASLWVQFKKCHRGSFHTFARIHNFKLTVALSKPCFSNIFSLIPFLKWVSFLFFWRDNIPGNDIFLYPVFGTQFHILIAYWEIRVTSGL